MTNYETFVSNLLSSDDIILTITIDEEFGRLVRVVRDNRVICYLDGREVRDKKTYQKIEKKYFIPQNMVSVIL